MIYSVWSVWFIVYLIASTRKYHFHFTIFLCDCHLIRFLLQFWNCVFVSNKRHSFFFLLSFMSWINNCLFFSFFKFLLFFFVNNINFGTNVFRFGWECVCMKSNMICTLKKSNRIRNLFISSFILFYFSLLKKMYLSRTFKNYRLLIEKTIVEPN